MIKRVIQKKGATLIEFSITIMVYLMIIFGIFEFGLMMALQNGNKASLFYGARYGATHDDINMNQIRTFMISKHSDYAFGTLDYAHIDIVLYDTLIDRATHTDPHIQTNESNMSSKTYVYTVSSPYRYITNFFQPADHLTSIITQETVFNEAF